MISQKNTEKTSNKFWEKPWPSKDLETVGHCPVCGDTSRNILHADLVDDAFHSAPGKWALWSCTKCYSAYLDPRPSSASIHLAYQNYYTHQRSERLSPEQLNGIRWLQRVLANGYKNWKFGTDLQPSSIFGVPVTFLIPSIRATLNRQFRHLQSPPTDGCLLDVGFGDGGFMENAMLIGWNVVGIDLDIETVKNARQRGLNVHHGSLEKFTDIQNKFDVITMCHVIEHMHDPVASLRACHRLLKPGGQLWLETPNIKSLGYSLFKKHWRGLEAPRHLILFNSKSLIKTLIEIGFTGVECLPQPSPCDGVYTQSQHIKDGLDPNINKNISISLRAKIAVAKLIEIFFRSRREFIAITAIKF